MQFFAFTGSVCPRRIRGESKPGPVHYTNMRVTLRQRRYFGLQDTWNRFQLPLAAT